DGNVQVTQDGGKSWTNVTGNIAALGGASIVSSVEASRHDPSTAYATFDRHMSGDMRPYAYKTTDTGRTWQPLVASDSGVRGYAPVVQAEPVDRSLRHLGAEAGRWNRSDLGRRWAQASGSEAQAA